MDQKTYLRKLCRDLRRLEIEHRYCFRADDFDNCDLIIQQSEIIEDAIFNAGLTSRRIKPRCYGLGDFIAELRTHYKKRPKEYGEGYRPHHCDIIYTVEGQEHRFEVRGWRMEGKNLYVNACNWTICAGACTLVINEDNLQYVRIEGLI